MKMFFGPIVADCVLGPSAWVAWMESGCQVHSFLPSNLVTIDCYSCKSYDEDTVVEVAKKYFKPKPENIEVF
jgi:S-adenosylmethionine/arginine decarboxylase-like enzyme